MEAKPPLERRGDDSRRGLSTVLASDCTLATPVSFCRTSGSSRAVQDCKTTRCRWRESARPIATPCELRKTLVMAKRSAGSLRIVVHWAGMTQLTVTSPFAGLSAKRTSPAFGTDGGKFLKKSSRRSGGKPPMLTRVSESASMTCFLEADRKKVRQITLSPFDATKAACKSAGASPLPAALPGASPLPAALPGASPLPAVVALRSSSAAP
mmetsp:Transcript_125407/g.267720  ORF Transcript_125407/g.267720 Transcript_125407/m.267720 type:complete len:210 (+) Transcript_125407:1094-1723(+)